MNRLLNDLPLRYQHDVLAVFDLPKKQPYCTTSNPWLTLNPVEPQKVSGPADAILEPADPIRVDCRADPRVRLLWRGDEAPAAPEPRLKRPWLQMEQAPVGAPFKFAVRLTSEGARRLAALKDILETDREHGKRR